MSAKRNWSEGMEWCDVSHRLRHPNGAYTLECDDVPSEDEIREADASELFSAKQLAPSRCSERTP